MSFCPNCGKPTDENMKFCASCGATLLPVQESETDGPAGASTPQGISGAAVTPTSADPGVKEKKKKQFKLSKKSLMFGGIGAAVIAVVLVAVMLISSLVGDKRPNYLLYFKDSEIFYKDFSKNDVQQMSTGLFTGDLEDDENYYDMSMFLEDYCLLSGDGSLFFYPDDFNESDDGMNLYYRYVNKPNKEPVKIDSEVVNYIVDENTKYVIYRCDNGSLYQYDIQSAQKNKIDSDVSTYQISRDATKIIYLTYEDNNVFLWNSEKGSELIAEAIENLYCIFNEDTVVIYYEKDGTLYKNTEGKDAQQLASDISDILTANNAGIYYIKSNSETGGTLLDVVNDDMKESDAAMTEPVAPSYPNSYMYSTLEEYLAACDQYDADWEKYQTAYTAYNEKLYRDSLREELADESFYEGQGTICFNDGSAEKIISTSSSLSTYDALLANSYDQAILVFQSYDLEAVPSVNLSEASDLYELRSMLYDAYDEAKQVGVAVGGSVTMLPVEDSRNYVLSEDGSVLYYIDQASEDDETDSLYKVTLSGSTVGSPELVDSEVSGIVRTIGNEILYSKDADGATGDLYLSGKLIDYDCALDLQISEDEESGCLLYYTDAEEIGATLNMYNGKESVKIADDVIQYFLLPDGSVAYLYDFRESSQSGELHYYNNGKDEKIDDDVQAIMTFDYGSSDYLYRDKLIYRGYSD